MRCYECGNRVEQGQAECQRCKAAVWALEGSAMDVPTPVADSRPSYASSTLPDQGRQAAVLTPSRGEMALARAGSVFEGTATAGKSVLEFVIPPKSTVQGLVSISEPFYNEAPDLDPCRIITRILWIILLLPLIVVGVIVCLLFRRMSPINIYAMLGIFKFLNPASRNEEQVPVRYFRIRQPDTDAEVMVRMKGKLTHGSVGQNDRVTLSGRFRGGTLHATEGYNHRTSSTIGLQQSYSWIGLVLTLIFILFVVVAVHSPKLQGSRTMNAARTMSTMGGVE